jgi:hypothetical protein
MATSPTHQHRWQRLETLSNSNAFRTGHAAHSERDPAAAFLLAQPAHASISPRPVNQNGSAYTGHQQQHGRPSGSPANQSPLTNDMASNSPPPGSWSPHNIQYRPVSHSESDPAAFGLLPRPTHPPMPPQLVNQNINGSLSHEQNERLDGASANGHPPSNDAETGPSGPRPLHSIPGWPTAAQEAGQTGKSTVVWRLIDILLFLVSLLTIVMASFAKIADRKTVDAYPGYQKIIGVTAVVRRSLRSFYLG